MVAAVCCCRRGPAAHPHPVSLGRFALADTDHTSHTEQASMAKPMVVTPPCAACGIPSARIELVAPGHFPAEWEQWPSTVRASIVRQREPGQWYLLFKGVAAYNG